MNDAIQGTWRIERSETKRQPEESDDVVIAEPELTIDADTITSRIGFSVMDVGDYRLESTTEPKGIDVAFRFGKLKGKSIKGIYRLEQDHFWFCFSQAGEDRPTRFASVPDKGWELVSLVRTGNRPDEGAG